MPGPKTDPPPAYLNLPDEKNRGRQQIFAGTFQQGFDTGADPTRAPRPRTPKKASEPSSTGSLLQQPRPGPEYGTAHPAGSGFPSSISLDSSN